MIRQDAAMPVSRFCALIGIPRRSYARWQARARVGAPVKGPWPAPVVDAIESLVAKLDFSEYETTTGGIWRLAGVCDYYSKYEYGWHIAPTCTGADAISSVKTAIAEAERLASGIPLIEQLTDPATGEVRRIKLVTDNGGAFKGHAFAAFIASRSELAHIRTRRKSPRSERRTRTRLRLTKVRAPLPHGDRDPTGPDPRGRRVPAGVQPCPAARGTGLLQADRSSSQSGTETSNQDHRNPTFTPRILSQVLDAGHVDSVEADRAGFCVGPVSGTRFGRGVAGRMGRCCRELDGGGSGARSDASGNCPAGWSAAAVPERQDVG